MPSYLIIPSLLDLLLLLQEKQIHVVRQNVVASQLHAYGKAPIRHYKVVLVSMSIIILDLDIQNLPCSGEN